MPTPKTIVALRDYVVLMKSTAIEYTVVARGARVIGIKSGDTVIANTQGAIHRTVDGHEYLIVREQDIFGRVEATN